MTREGAEGRRVTLAVEDREFAAAAALPTGTLWAVGRSDNADLIVNSSNAQQPPPASAPGTAILEPPLQDRGPDADVPGIKCPPVVALPATYLASYGAP